VIGSVVARARVHESRQVAAVESEPLGDKIKLLTGDQQLATSTGVWANRSALEISNIYAESRSRLQCKLARLFDLDPSEVGVSMEVSGCFGGIASRGGSHQKKKAGC
jgi:hypothetical protein